MFNIFNKGKRSMSQNYKFLGLLVIGLSLIISYQSYAALIETNTSGGVIGNGQKVKEKFRIKQTKYDDFATDLHFKLWQKEDNIDINGWNVNISGFNNSSSQRGNQPGSANTTVANHPGVPETTSDPDNGQHAVDVNADNGIINKGDWVIIEAEFDLTHKNTKRIADVEWTKDNNRIKAVADMGVSTEDPVALIGEPGYFWHTLFIFNDDLTDHFWLTDLKFLADYVDYFDLDTVPFQLSSTPDVLLAPGEFFTKNIKTKDPMWGGSIYAEFNMALDNNGTPGEIVAIDTYQHVIKATAPKSIYIFLASILLMLLLRREYKKKKWNSVNPHPIICA
jgi:hypothetical protein